LGIVSSLGDWTYSGIKYLINPTKGRLLDIGCGDGSFLALMRDLGWKVVGLEPDPVAAKGARERFLIPVVEDTLEDARLPHRSFDVITLNHVIEHVYDPVSFLKECRRVIKPGGRVVITTPNFSSLGHTIFKRFWRALDAPRHLYLFEAASLQKCVAQSHLRIEVVKTVPIGAFEIGDESWRIAGGLNKRRSGWVSALFGLAFLAVEGVVNAVYKSRGETLLVVATSVDRDD